MQTIFTVGQVAKICKVAPRTVSKWFDSGRLRGYRIPGSQDRRIPREHLIRFLKEHGMPLGELEDESLIKVLLIFADCVTRRELEAASNGEFKVAVAASGFEAGIIIESEVPDCVVIYFSHRDALTIAAQIKRNPNLVDTSIIGLVYGVEELSDAERSVLTAVCSQKFGKTELADASALCIAVPNRIGDNMLYSVSGDLRPVRKWASNRKGCSVDRHSEDTWDVKFVADDEDDFVEMCDDNDIEYEFLADGTGSLDC